MTDRSVTAEEKRRLILDAAVRVFARKGFHTCRVGDISDEAGVAHGLLGEFRRDLDPRLAELVSSGLAAEKAAAPA